MYPASLTVGSSGSRRGINGLLVCRTEKTQIVHNKPRLDLTYLNQLMIVAHRCGFSKPHHLHLNTNSKDRIRGKGRNSELSFLFHGESAWRDDRLPYAAFSRLEPKPTVAIPDRRTTTRRSLSDAERFYRTSAIHPTKPPPILHTNHRDDSHLDIFVAQATHPTPPSNSSKLANIGCLDEVETRLRQRHSDVTA